MLVRELLIAPKHSLDPDLVVTRRFKVHNNILGLLLINKDSSKAYNILIMSDSFPITMDSTVKLFCNCDNFKFQWAYVLEQHQGLLDPKNGQFILTPPKKTNPNQDVGICKHLFTALTSVLNDEIPEMSMQVGKV